jgi:subfamily B ATP-binding cassette protein MsbA
MASPIAVFGTPDTEADAEAEEAKDEEDIDWIPAFAFLGSRLVQRPGLIALTVFLGLLSSAANVLSLSLIFPFIETLQGGSGGLASESRLGFLIPYFQQFSTRTQVQLVAAGLFATQLVKGVVKYLSSRLISYQRVLFDLNLRQDIFDQILALEMRYINQDKVANLYTILRQFSSDSASAAKRMLKFIPRSATLIGYLVAVVLVSWKLTLASLVLAGITLLAIEVIIRFIRRMSRKINVLRVRLKHRALESLNALKVIHTFGREDHARDRYREELRTYQSNKYRRTLASAAVTPVYNTLMMGMFAAILIAGTFLLDTSTATWVGLLSMFIIVLMRLMGPTGKFAKMKSTFSKRLPSVAKVADFLDESDKPFLDDGEVPYDGLDERLRLEDVWFRYDEEDEWALRGVDLEVPKGSTVALVGSSGAGKSTLVDLVARLYDPTEGRVRVDGRDLRDHRIRGWRRHLAVVGQDTFLFNESAMENIRYGRLDASDEEVREAARRANAHEFLVSLPDGYDTELGERGVRLSGGQKQRIAIARAILADPDLLLLDEATSSLDTDTEQQVQQALDDVSEDRTVIAIAHRLSTIQDADVIAVMEDGEIVERGTHDELIDQRGAYHRYVEMQELREGPARPGTNVDEADDEQVYVVPGDEEGWGVARRNGTELGRVELFAGSGEDFVDRGQNFCLVDEDGSATARIDGRVYEDVPVREDD